MATGTYFTRATENLKDAKRISENQQSPFVWTFAFFCVAAIFWALMTIAVAIESKN